MNAKKVLVFAVIVVLLAVFFWPDNKIKVASVENGNTLTLTNGATVKLLGVEPTLEGKEELNKIKGLEVELVADESASFDPRKVTKGVTVNAYMLLPKNGYECINASLLRLGVAGLVENCPDSLKSFKRYAAMGSKSGVKPQPEPVKVIDYEEDDIDLDPYVPSGERKHSRWYVEGNLNLEMLEEACDYNLPYTKKFANELAARAPGTFSPEQVCEIFSYCYSKWRYVNDPADSEYVAKASESIYNSLTGDCDDFAILMASCILSIGGRPCINTGYNPNGGHAFTEVDIASFNENDVLGAIQSRFPEYNVSSLNTRRDGQHLWLNLDWQAAHPGGNYYNCSSGRDSYPYENGRWTWKKLK